MGSRRGSRRRRRPANPPPDATSADAPQPEDADDSAEGAASGGYGKAALLLALLVGTLLQRLAVTTLSADALDIFYLAVAIGIAFLGARWYRNFMRRTLGRARVNRRGRSKN